MSERITIYRKQLERIKLESKGIKAKKRSPDSVHRYETTKIELLSQAAGRAVDLFTILALYELKTHNKK